MKQKYVIELKILAIMSMANLTDLQTYIFIHFQVFKEHFMYLLQSNI